MFGSPFFRSMEEDPFFRGHMTAFNQMDRMMNDMMGGMMHPAAPAIGYGRDYERRGERHAERRRDVGRPGTDMMAFGHRDPFQGIFSNMMQNMAQMSQHMEAQMDRARNDPNAQFYSSSTVMSYSNNGSGQPQIYQASSSTRTAPGGVRETRKSVRDSQVGLEKMAVGHHIHDKGHVITRQRNTRTGDREENTDLINLGEDERDAFERDWQSKIEAYNRELGGGPRRIHGAGRHGNRYHHESPYRRPPQPAAIEYRDRE